ncbi:MAG: hypothetical protein BRC24_01395 [Parcubacteria group bacterium SW_4_46_8]|nr:MAG: hypothetical protein BRC24_01395 [Parcubacteria group bacterium SW_4_46_8]
MERTDIIDLLLPWEEYIRRDYSIPYSYTICKSNKLLSYIGVHHCTDYEHPQNVEIKHEWKHFIAKSPAQKCIAVVEGSVPPESNNEKTAIQAHGERGLLAFLARSQDISLRSFEPDDKEVLQSIASMYSKKIAFYSEAARVIYQWHNVHSEQDFTTYLEQYLQEDLAGLGWNDISPTLKQVKEIHQQLFDSSFDKKDSNFFYSILHPSKDKSVINKVNRDKNKIRDSSVVQGIVSAWKAGNSIFVVYGSSHAVVQEPAVRQILK